MGEDQEVGLGEAGDFDAHSGTEIGIFSTAYGLEPRGAQE